MTPQQFIAVVDGIVKGTEAQIALGELTLERAKVLEVPDEIMAAISGLVGGATSLSVFAAIILQEIQKQVQTGEHRERPSGQCQHPEDERIPMKVMGHPNRFKCNACGETVD